MGFPGGSDGKESTFNTGDLGLTPGLGRSPGGGHGNPLQCSCLENSHGQRSLVGYSPWGHQESDGTQRLSTHVLRTYSTSTGYPVIRMCVCVGSQLCLTLCDPVDYSASSSSVHGISQASILELVAISFSRESSQPRRSNLYLPHCGRILYCWAIRETQ